MNIQQLQQIKAALESSSIDSESHSWGPTYELAQQRRSQALEQLVQAIQLQQQLQPQPKFDYTELDEAQKVHLLLAGHNFLQALCAVCDAACAQTVFDALADHVHPSFKLDLLMRMMSGGMGKVRLTSVGTNMITCIKIIRSHTSLGLKEAKDLVDQARIGAGAELIVANHDARSQLVQQLRAEGCTVQSF
jgi:hypothetical protein